MYFLSILFEAIIVLSDPKRMYVLRVSSVGIMLFELAYFVDALLLMCLPCPPDWQVFLLWGKMARLGGFQKFLYYSIMSVVCFLHPVLVWHAIIPGTMMLPGYKMQDALKTPPTEVLLQFSVRNVVEVPCFFFSWFQGPSAPKETERQRRRWKDRRQVCLTGRQGPVEREMEEFERYCEPEPETSSDTAPMITD
uniref:Transmembrane protein 72 n=1 Tax=Myripristis murdjan TaxID=586833 RepID=A0A667WN54_9TELE